MADKVAVLLSQKPDGPAIVGALKGMAVNMAVALPEHPCWLVTVTE